LDPTSQSFRYPVDKNGMSSLPEEMRYFDIRVFAQKINKIAKLLEGASGGISEYMEYQQEMIKEMRNAYR